MFSKKCFIGNLLALHNAETHISYDCVNDLNVKLKPQKGEEKVWRGSLMILHWKKPFFS